MYIIRSCLNPQCERSVFHKQYLPQGTKGKQAAELQRNRMNEVEERGRPPRQDEKRFRMAKRLEVK